jgi:hypothetical protein
MEAFLAQCRSKGFRTAKCESLNTASGEVVGWAVRIEG